ncbi:MAG: tRNA (adenosine(37)-N6)-threonylcarbamoyltransferase complex dimerization subunit type 1 TsaB [Candidatus Eremiobacteraeota bacterium]|nr:tRNA (adenosine(37)-N6)-threonylcarbamoyltransferase complex dimerization subunit type 1 TsaB [Candidatus Eremiobacteraeota bacterium]
MIVLGLDGALGGFSASIAVDDAVVATISIAGNVALEAGLGAVRELLDGAHYEPSQLNRIAVGVGPGSFTGLRITIAYAKSLAQAWRIPLAGISSFDALEYGRSAERALTVVVGRPGIISARYRDGSAQRRASGKASDVLANILPRVDERTLPVLGAPEDVFAYLAEGGFIVEPRSPIVTPPAAAIALAGVHARAAASIHEVRADYGEAPAAHVPTFRPTDRKR